MKLLKLVGAGVAAAILLGGCATTSPEALRPQEMTAAEQKVPAARGEVRAKPGDHGNTIVEVSVSHLARPEQVSPEAETYVVWAQDRSGEGGVQNLGALQVNEDLSATLETITPLQQFDVFITPEPKATAQSPTGERTLWASVSM